MDVTPPPFSQFFPVDPALAASGAPIYKAYCAGCHGASGSDFSGEYVGQVTPLAEIGSAQYFQALAARRPPTRASSGEHVPKAVHGRLPTTPARGTPNTGRTAVGGLPFERSDCTDTSRHGLRRRKKRLPPEVGSLTEMWVSLVS